VTAAGIHRRPPGTVPPPAAYRPVTAALRLTWLYLESRRAPAALGLIAGLAALLGAALAGRWTIAGGPAAQNLVPLVVVTGAAAVIAVTTYGPFDDPERAAGLRLPGLRLGAALLLTAVAFGALAAGATGGGLPGGTLALARDLAGLTGTGLLASVVIGGAFAWAGPMAYLLVTEGALAGGWATPWIWSGRPPHDLGAALCAYGVFAAGLAAVTLLGVRDSGRGRTRRG
jgi:hypothetical protein